MSITFARWPLLIFAALAVAVLLGCGDDDDATPTPAASGTGDGGPTSSARAPDEFAGACSLLAIGDVVQALTPSEDLVVDDEGDTCTYTAESTLTVALDERDSAEEALSAAEAVGGEAVQVGADPGYLSGTTLVTSRGVYVVTFTLEPADDETLVGLARRAVGRVPTPTATPE